jgi:hypothetical protein
MEAFVETLQMLAGLALLAGILFGGTLLIALAVKAQDYSTHPLPALQPPPGGYFPTQDGYLPPDRRPIAVAPLPQHAVIKPAAVPPLVVLRDENGGRIEDHRIRFAGYRDATKVEVRGRCLSACTLVTAYVPKERLCFAPGAFLAFHSAWNKTPTNSPKASLTESVLMYISYPEPIRHWIDDRGGPTKLTVEDWWILDAPALWRMGYPRCP